MTEHRLLTVQQTADLLTLTPRTLYRWRAQGVGPRSLKVGGLYVRYRQADVLAWLEDGGALRPARRRVGRPRSA